MPKVDTHESMHEREQEKERGEEERERDTNLREMSI
jgi:hypothetical protein